MLADKGGGVGVLKGAGAGALEAAGRVVGSVGSGAGERTGALEHATRLPTIAQPNHRHKRCCMTLILLEALGAGLLLVLIVWWTMFSGRERGEPMDHPNAQETSKVPDSPSTQTGSSTHAANTADDPTV